MKRVAVLIGAVTVIGGAAAGIGYQQYSKQTSLRAGIAQTEQALRQVDQLIDENQIDVWKFLAKLEVDVGAALGKGGPLGDAVSRYKQVSSGLQGVKAIQERDYMTAIEKTAEQIADVWQAVDSANPALPAGRTLIAVAANVYTAQAMLRQQASLIETQMRLQDQLLRLRGKDPETQAELARSFPSNLPDYHAAFLQSLQGRGLSRPQVAEQALREAAADSCRAAANAGAGAAILDPDQGINDIATIPGINPEFIEALRRQNALLARGDLASVQLAGTVNKTGGFAYIPIFAAGANRALSLEAADPTCEHSTGRVARDSKPADQLGSLSALLSQVSGKKEFHCCQYEHLHECESLRDNVRKAMAGHRLPLESNRPDSPLAEAKDVNVCVVYSTDVTATERHDIKDNKDRIGDPDTRKLRDYERLCADGKGGYNWISTFLPRGVSEGGTPEYDACVLRLGGAGADVYKNQCGGRDKENRERQHATTLHVTGDQMTRESLEEIRWSYVQDHTKLMASSHIIRSTKSIGQLDHCFIKGPNISFAGK